MSNFQMLSLVQLACLSALFAAGPKSDVIVRVNGVAITKADVEFAAVEQNIPAEKRSDEEPKLVETLIDRQLIRTFLAAKKIEPNADELQHQIGRAEDFIRRNGEDPKEFLTKLGYTPERLKSELGLPLAWQVYARRTINSEQLKQYFDQHKQELDGTQLRARQIFLGIPRKPSETDISERKAKLESLRSQILAGKLSFADAAKMHSEAPSREDGGDVGLFGWRGKLPKEVSKAAFDLKVDEISEPIVTVFGVHLIQVTERHPGDFSLEDVRPVIFERLSQQLWASTAANARQTAKIVWLKK